MPSHISKSLRAALAAARSDSAQVVRRWREGAEYRALGERFAGLEGSADAAADRAEALLADAGWAEALLAPLIDALAADPFFEPPFTVTRDRLRAGAMVFDCPALSIAAAVTSADAMAALPVAESVVIPGRLAVTRYVRGGGARLRRWRAEPVTPAFSAATAGPAAALAPMRLADGLVARSDGRVQGHVIESARSDIVTLTATIRAGGAPLMREYATADGRLLRVGAAGDQVSRTEMLLTLLRLSGRSDAGDCFDAATRDAAFHLRWAAMREWLALDARAALPRLEALAEADPHGEVRAAAAATLAALRQRIDAPCRA